MTMMMELKFIGDKIKMKKLKPIIKFNSGSGAILCNKCRIIIKSNLTKNEWEGHTPLLFCEKCAKEELEDHLDKLLGIYQKKNE